MSNVERCAVLRKAFDDALASPLSCLVLDNLERILGFSRVGPIYSNEVLQTLLLLLRRPPGEGRRLLVIATTSSADVMQASSSSTSPRSASLALSFLP
jgi:vesicle-fusing ATPase